MNKIITKARITAFFLVFTSFLIVGFLFLNVQRNLKLAKAEEENMFQKAAKNSLENYRQEYLATVKKSKEENTKTMADTKTTYELLLSQQAGILSQHKRQIAMGGDANQQTGSSTGQTVTNNSSTVKKTTVAKPVSKRPTKTS